MTFCLRTRSPARFRRRSVWPQLFNPSQPLQLPVELWDVILNLLTNDGLLQTACVSRGWNELSLAIYMRRHNVTPATASIDVPAFFLGALHLACVPPPIIGLRCTFPTFDMPRRMRSLAGVIAKCPRLTSLSAEWRYDPFRAHSGSHAAVVTIIRDIVRTLADRTPGPIIVVGSETIQRFDRKDIPRWPARYLLIGQPRDVRASVLGRGTNTDSSFYLNRLEWVHVRSIRGSSGALGCFTLVTFPTASLTLSPTKNLTS
ncbi:hypothetical protein B0H14DRAFT_3854814, partial [Mycena olivaceomarginata]